ncbi:hypothetical protein NDS46_31435 (plasmid) [Paenibacillus thiaminolyticus]|uniref:hypothetical protein n=1 Tax=Paenibacillus thiaminolyticus TaxID=49283 RepID=UPI00232AF47D|nr:hypothetical protein [Paenibacillus thiaminolyticus]WCF11472.1 hypothetical protein NDS46_31435 [Paenibacillus thiaminolyticus]
MKKTKVLITKQSDTHWMVWCQDGTEVKAADIHKIEDFGFLGRKSRYRVDVDGKTVQSMIDHFSTAKSIATKQIR